MCENFSEEAICHLCLENLDKKLKIKKPFCYKCGTPLYGKKCKKCFVKIFKFDKVRGCYLYKDEITKMVELMKFRGFLSITDFMAAKMSEVIQKEGMGPYDFLIPVPLHPARIRERGFSQTELLSQKISKRIQVPVIKPLIRFRYTKSQTLLKRAERVKNVRNAFLVVEELREELKGKRFLIVEDVMTTGSTLNEISKLLKKEVEPQRIDGIVFAIAP